MKTIQVNLKKAGRELRGDITSERAIAFLVIFMFNEHEKNLYVSGKGRDALKANRERLGRDIENLTEEEAQEVNEQIAEGMLAQVNLSRWHRAKAAWKLEECFPGQVSGLVEFFPAPEEFKEEGHIRLDIDDLIILFSTILSAAFEVSNEALKQENADESVEDNSLQKQLPAIAPLEKKDDLTVKKIEDEVDSAVTVIQDENEDSQKKEDPVPAIAPSPKVIDFDNLTEEEKSELAQKYEELKLQKSKS